MTAPRLPLIGPADMTAEQADLYGRLVSDERRGGPKAMLAQEGGVGLAGPFNAFLLSPEIGDSLQSLGRELRFGGQLSDRVREIVILTVAAARGSEFEWNAHVRIGRRAGLTDEEIDGIAAGTGTLDAAPEQVAYLLAQAMVIEREVADELYVAAISQFGTHEVFELSVLVGYYDLLALQMRVFGSYS
jgi:4-carboxymuconolactone decarboxylase